MKTSHKLLWGLFGVIVITMMSVATAMRLDLKESLPVAGNGQIQDSTFQVEAFNSMTISNGMSVKYQPGQKHEVRIVTDANLIANVYVNVRGDWLTISKDNDFGQATSIEIYVTSPEIREINVHNSGSVSIDSVLHQEALRIGASNSGTIHLMAVTKNLRLDASNSGAIFVSGETEDLDASASSSGAIEAGDLLSHYADVSAEGSSSVKVRVNERLVSRCNGGSSVLYSGPESLNVKANGRIKPIAIHEEDVNAD